ncbi:low temperature requirement protein A [Pseudoclavibacter helvolus]|uniref:low temperature requirement protein A n=1 Tax=Pseudoclavibacter helvolus TaxID=255205 RepID=UPI003C71E667
MTSLPTRHLRRMQPRDPHEQHRAASPLELFFDLVFVVAVAFSSQTLHHMEADGHLGSGVLGYLMVFFAIWWAWMNFTWFATAFDTDDWLYRVMTILQMAGVLVLAAGTGPAMEHHDFTLVTAGYVIMRLALVGQWVRAALSHPELRTPALRYATAITVVQALWVARLFLPGQVGFIAFFVLVMAEIAIPIWAESSRPTPWNAHHIAERFGLFTLILLGESILASANAVLTAIEEGQHIPDLLTISAAGLIIAAGMWWVYFAREQHHHITSLRSSLTFGYVHYLIFAAAGAFSAGIEVAIDSTDGHTDAPTTIASATLTIPVALFVLGTWALTLRHTIGRAATGLLLTGVGVILTATFLPGTGTVIGVAAGVTLAAIATERHQQQQVKS